MDPFKISIEPVHDLEGDDFGDLVAVEGLDSLPESRKQFLTGLHYQVTFRLITDLSLPPIDGADFGKDISAYGARRGYIFHAAGEKH